MAYPQMDQQNMEAKANATIYESLDASKKEIRLLLILPELSKSRLVCKLQVVSLLNESILTARGPACDALSDIYHGPLNGSMTHDTLVVQTPTEHSHGNEICTNGSVANHCHSIETSTNAITLDGRLMNDTLADKLRSNGFLADHSGADESWPKYEAISWCWGNAQHRTDILLNGHVVPIPSAAVETIRRVGLDHRHYRIWIDAVCINMLDDEERSQQVGMMKDIYAKAVRVLIWLGDADDTTQAALESINLLVTQCKQKLPDVKDHMKKCLDEFGNLRRTPRSLPNCDWNAIRNFYSRPWFSRLWVTQEVLLSRAAVFFVGDSSSSWEDVCLATFWLYSSNYHRLEYCNGHAVGIEIGGKLWCYLANNDLTLSNLLALSRQTLTTLPIDKVFSILAIHQSKSSATTNLRDLAVDYKLSVENVYETATRRAIEELVSRGRNGPLAILNMAQTHVPFPSNSDEHENWPSWVPRFDSVWDMDRGSPRDVLQRGRGASYGYWRGFPEDNQDMCLHLFGIIVGPVTSLGVVIDYELWNNENALAAEILRRRHEIASMPVNDDEYCLTMTCGLTQKDREVLTDTAPSNISEGEDYLRYCDGRPNSDLTPGARYYRHDIWLGSANRRFFTSDRNRIGMVPRETDPGDLICILFGGDVPFILRQEGDYFRLIGTAYVHGIMEGEYIQRLQAEDRLEAETKKFMLR